MVGFKSIALLISLLVLAACVPQTKQTSCSTNEAFNATLRTCVPVMNGPSSFINIDSFLPASSFAKYKNDTLPVTLSIVIDNPYAQAYSIVWEHIFTGVAVQISPSTPTSFTFSPSLYSSQLGTHIISVKIKDANFNDVDSHSFEFKIDDTLKPVIDNSSVSPMYSPISFTPLVVADQYFKFTVKNNNAIMVGAGYKVDWKLDKSGTGEITAAAESDVFPTTLPAGVGTIINNAGFNYPSYSFNPATLGVGDYLLSAKLTNSAGDLVDFKYWNVNVKHPSLSKVSARDIYSASTSVGFGTYSTAYSGVAYTDYSSLQPLDKGFIPLGQSTQGNYCVTLTNAEGTYIGDSQYVRVDYYLDNASLVYSTTTSTAVGGNKVCLSNAGAALANVKFVTAGIPHSITARVVDQATGQEYTASDMNAALGTYPITWNFTVLEANAAPIVSFTSDSNLSPSITCGTASANARTCAVTQDQAFTVGISVTDDFYSTSSTTDSIQNKFAYTMTLKRNGTTISTCTKTIADVNEALPSPDVVGPDYLCSFTVPSYDATGSVDPSAFAYTVTTVFSDVGSPIAGALPASGTSLTYNLNVTEVNTAPVIVPQGITTSDSYLANSNAPTVPLALSSNDTGAPTTYITEGDVMMVKVLLNDAERDDHQITLIRCTDGPACASSITIETKTVTKSDNVLGTLTTFSYTIPEDVVPTSTAFGTNVDTYFKIEVLDNPDTDTPLIIGSLPQAQTAVTSTVAPLHFNVNVRNNNPAPQFALDNALLTTHSITTMVGYPLTIDPGTITDLSIPASEKVISYQWYIDVNDFDDTYTAITGATSRVLYWTPTNGILPGQTINLSLCVSDGTTVNPQPAVGTIGAKILATNSISNGSNCLGSWNVTVRPNVVALNNDDGTASDVGSDMAVWQDTTVTNKKVIYSAYNDINGKIFVEKTVFEDNGLIHNNNVDGFQTVSFDAIDGMPVAVSSIKDISISGTDDFLYLAYQAAPSGTPGSPIIRIRRIDKRSGVTTGSKTDSSYPEDGKFGFRYSQNLPTSLQTTPNITISSISTGGPYQVSFGGALISGDFVTVNGVSFVASDTAPTGGVLCSGGSLGCSVSGNATLLAAAINSSSNRNIQGLTAIAIPASGNVWIYGDVGDESRDLSAYVTGKLGKIITYKVGTWKWYLPFVDASTALSKIRLLEAPAEAADYLQGVAIDDLDTYNEIGPVTSFVNDAFGGTMVIGSINTSSIAKLHLFTLGSAISSSNATLFGGAPVAAGTLKVAARVAGNSNYFAAAKVLVTSPATYEWKFGRYSTSLAAPLEDTFTSLSYNTTTGTVLDVDNIADLSIEAYPSSNEARIMVSSNNGTSDYDLFAVRYRSDGDLSCDLCVPLTYGAQKLSASGKIATAKIDIDMKIGSTNVTDTLRDVLFTAYAVDSDADSVYEPQVGIINAEVETISTTSTVSTGINGFRPPFFGSN